MKKYFQHTIIKKKSYIKDGFIISIETKLYLNNSMKLLLIVCLCVHVYGTYALRSHPRSERNIFVCSIFTLTNLTLFSLLVSFTGRNVTSNTCSLLRFIVGSTYYVELEDNGPVIVGANIKFTANLYINNKERPKGDYKYQWRDNTIPQHIETVLLFSLIR